MYDGNKVTAAVTAEIQMELFCLSFFLGHASCSASGDPHYNTFDHKVLHFMGNCTYTLSKVCNISQRIPYFDVSTTNEHRGANTKVSYVKSVQVEVYGNQISMLKNKKVNVRKYLFKRQYFSTDVQIMTFFLIVEFIEIFCFFSFVKYTSYNEISKKTCPYEILFNCFLFSLCTRSYCLLNSSTCWYL